MTAYYAEMQQYIDILPYRDTLGSDTVSISIRYIDIFKSYDSYRYIESLDISTY